MFLPSSAVIVAEILNNYSGYVDAGHDPEFGCMLLTKLKAPYCAKRAMPCEIITCGGIARNEASEMIGTDGTVIPGLYTASDASVNSAYMGFTITNAAAFVNWLCSFGLLLGKGLFCAKKGNRQEKRELSINQVYFVRRDSYAGRYAL